jgi:Tfp pilus assembly protein PilO
MKINQRYVILICIVVFIIAFAFLYMSYTKQTNEHKLAQQNLDNANATYTSVTKEKAKQENLLTQANSQVAQLQSQLSQAQLQLREKQQVIPAAIENIDYNELLFNIAHTNKLLVLNINTTGPTENQVDKVSLYVTMFTISVKGETSDILNFVNDLATDTNFVSGTIDGVTMTVTTEQTPDGETITTTQGDISLSLYGYGE